MRRAPVRTRLWLTGASAVLLAACGTPNPATTPTPAPPPGPSRSSSPAPGPATPSAPPPATPSATPRPASYEVPLVLAVHATREVADVPLAAARRLLAGDVSRWSDLEQPGGGRVRVVRGDGPDRDPAAALARVRDDDGVLAVVPATAVDARVRVLDVAGRDPLREPGRYPLKVASPTPYGRVTTLTVVGDMMLGRRVGRAIGNDVDEPFAPLAKRLRSADVTVGNLESTLSTAGSPTQGGDSFAASPRVLDGLDGAGFDVVTLANNHLGDYGPRAMRQTFAALRDADLPYVGAGRDRAEARRGVVVERDGTRIGFYATESIGETPAAGRDAPGTNRLDMPPRTGPLDRGALGRTTDDIAALKKRVDVVVVLPHWGTQYTHRVEASQRTAAEAFAEAGADLVIGGHPHWVQGLQSFGSSTVLYSMGNFVFDMDFSRQVREGVLVEVTLAGGAVKAVRPVPYVIGDDFAPRTVGGDRAADILDDLWGSSRGAFREPD